MHVLYDEDGHVKVATVMDSQDGALAIESPPPHRKRSKLRADRVLLEFSDSALAGVALDALLSRAQAQGESIDIELLWQCVDGQELGFVDLAREYYGHAPTPVEAAAVLLRLGATPSHFHRRPRGVFRAATETEIAAARVAASRRAEKAQRLSGLADALVRGELPREISSKLPGILYYPDANTLEAKAVQEAANRLHMTLPQLWLHCGGLKDARAYHVGRFILDFFPKGIGFGDLPDAAQLIDPPAGLPRAAVAAFSIDDITTTEIDDAFSVTRQPDGSYQVGIHIAAPGLGFQPDSRADQLARARLSTVYMPGDKFTMLPDPIVDAFSLDEGRDCPALSLYLTVAGDGSYRILSTDTRVDSVPIVKNLRYPILDDQLTDEVIAAGGGDFPFAGELCFLHGLASALWEARGKGEMDKTDFLFYVDRDGEGGEERVRIQPRRRGAPSDRIVSELMIYVNSTWGALLGDRDVHALFRVQDGVGKVRMSLYPAPHLSLGVPQYLWSSSPLRRYIDLVNQWQLIAIAYGETPPFDGRDQDLMAIMRDVEVTTPGYDDFQRCMERYYSLRFFQQEGLEETTAVVVKERDSLVRFERVPIWQRVHSLPELPVGTVVTLKLSRIDLFDLSLHCEYRAP